MGKNTPSMAARVWKGYYKWGYYIRVGELIHEEKELLAIVSEVV